MNNRNKNWLACCLLTGLALSAPIRAAEPPPTPAPPAGSAKQDYAQTVDQRLSEQLAHLKENGWPPPAKSPDFKQHMALLLLSTNEQVDEANRMILEYCGLGHMTTYVGKPVSKNRPEALLRTYLMERTHRLLGPEAKAAIEDFAWEILDKHSRVTFEDAQKSFWEFGSTENHYVNDRRRSTLALAVIRKSPRYGPEKMLKGHRVEDQYQAWVQFWIRYFRTRAGEGTDLEIAHYGSYGSCTIGVYYDLYDLTENAELRELAGKFLTLFWAETAAEFEPRTAIRGWAQTRMPSYYATGYWAKSLLQAYQWHDLPSENNFLGMTQFLVSDYRPPEILSAIASNPERGEYLSTSRRAGMCKEPKNNDPIIFDENGDSHIRRDVWYTPDYSLSTVSMDAAREYDVHITLAQTPGATFSADEKSRITVFGTGYYCNRATIGLTGPAVSIVARDPKAQVGLDRFKSNGTRVFISNGPLWDNRIEDPSGWFFTRCGDAYTAIRIPGSGYKITDVSYSWPNRKLKEIKEKRGWFLEFNDMWTPVVIQMGRAKDYESFEAFQKSVKENPLTYKDGKLNYKSEAGDTYEAWAKFPQLPKINGETLNLNPEYTYDSPYLKMKHGTNKAVISFPEFEDVVLEF